MSPTLQPRVANALAIARPTPAEPPVTTATPDGDAPDLSLPLTSARYPKLLVLMRTTVFEGNEEGHSGSHREEWPSSSSPCGQNTEGEEFPSRVGSARRAV